jgi:hypothetical protein
VGTGQGDDEHTSTVLLGTNPIVVGADATEVVTVRSLTKRLGDVVAVDDLTFSLYEGTVTGFLGPNGAGKTTTLRLLPGARRTDRRRGTGLRPPVRLTGSAVGRPGQLFVNFWPQNVHTACVRPNPHSLWPAVCMARVLRSRPILQPESPELPFWHRLRDLKQRPVIWWVVRILCSSRWSRT